MVDNEYTEWCEEDTNTYCHVCDTEYTVKHDRNWIPIVCCFCGNGEHLSVRGFDMSQLEPSE